MSAHSQNNTFQLNAHAQRVLGSIRFPELPAGSCSLDQEGNLAGTASHEPGWIALEQPGSWGHDVLDGTAFDIEIANALKTKIAASGGHRFLLIRKPGRLGQLVQDGVRRVFLATTEGAEQALYTFCVKDPTDLLDLPLDNPAKIPFAERLDAQVITLLCAHSKRDQCCALRGRPIARFLAEVRPANTVWECSHLSGHRYAPTGILLPSGYTYGRWNAHSALAATTCLEETGVPYIADLRGRSTLTPAHQAAEVAVRERLLERNEEPLAQELTFTPAPAGDSTQNPSQERTLVQHRDGRSWVVTCETRATSPVKASCGKPEKSAKSIEVLAVEEA